ncbi:MAG: hypothetical protein MJ207_00165 [Bacilli bacterium]|nr:hypothetical protein [Bacilli bacterium]
MKSKIKHHGIFCDMYLVPFYFVDPKSIKFPKDYQKKFKPFKNASEVLLAYGETMIILQRWMKLYKSSKKKANAEIKQILKIKDQLINKCFTTPHQSIMFYSSAMNDQFNYLYYLILKSYKSLSTTAK